MVSSISLRVIAFLIVVIVVYHQAGKRLVRQPGECIERELRAQWGEDWRIIIPTGAVVATVVLARVARTDLLGGCAVHDPGIEIGCALGTGRTHVDPWDDFSPGR